MTNPVALNNNAHRKLRVITNHGAEYGENVHITPVIADELPSLVLEYPVCLIKNPDTGHYEMAALLGFENGENLFLEESEWNAVYVPAHIRRQPFLIGLSDDETGQREAGGAMISIDMDHPRVQEQKGEALFDETGANTPFLDQVSEMLTALFRGMDSTRIFTRDLADRDLIEPVEVQVTLGDGGQKRFEGLYTVNRKKLSELKGDVLEQYHNRGYLQACLMINVSLGNIPKMLRLKDLRSG